MTVEEILARCPHSDHPFKPGCKLLDETLSVLHVETGRIAEIDYVDSEGMWRGRVHTFTFGFMRPVEDFKFIN